MRTAWRRAAPWAGLFGGAAAWFAHHQLATNLIFADCRIAGPWAPLGLGLVCAGAAVAAGVLSWRQRRSGPEVLRFAAWLSAGGAALFLLAIGFAMLAGLIIPACRS